MIQTIQVQGTEKRLYQLIAPLVMNPDVLSANNNYPFKTTEQYVWFIAIDKKSVVGFMPVEHRRSGCVINNYYVSGDNRETLSLLICFGSNRKRSTFVCRCYGQPSGCI